MGACLLDQIDSVARKADPWRSDQIPGGRSAHRVAAGWGRTKTEQKTRIAEELTAEEVKPGRAMRISREENCWCQTEPH
jgi:hypothetical protein